MKVPFNINLSGKTAIVTGGSGTLCSAMTYGLAVSGAKVAIIGRNIEKLASVSEKLTKNALDEYNKDVTIKGYSCNVINKDELTAAYETIKNELGSCDILINGAGGNQPGAITSIEMLKKDKEDSDYSFWNLDEDRSLHDVAAVLQIACFQDTLHLVLAACLLEFLNRSFLPTNYRLSQST